MKIRTTTTLVVAALLAAALGLAACGGDDQDETGVSVTGAWARASAMSQQNGAVYMTLKSAEGDTLTGVSVPASVARSAQLHESTAAGGAMGSGGGMMGMREVDRIDLPAGTAVALKPGGYHVMLLGLKRPIAAGDTIPVTLTFAKSGTVRADAQGRES